ncbi:MAG: hypothetical protein H7321_02555 [Bacteroidia bacterium]|nr:hypothetical protein [Bacteroidia bacterium]
MKKILTIILISINCLSCQNIMFIMAGYLPLKIRSDKEIKKFAEKNIYFKGYQLIQSDSYFTYLDDKDSEMHAADSNTADSFKIFLQPLKVLYYDENNKLVSVLTNCYAIPEGGQFNWNTENRLDKYPPVTHTPVFKQIPITEILKQTNLDVNTVDLKKKRSRVVISWNIFLNKESKHFLKCIQENLFKANDMPEVFYINNDNSLYVNSR